VDAARRVHVKASVPPSSCRPSHEPRWQPGQHQYAVQFLRGFDAGHSGRGAPSWLHMARPHAAAVGSSRSGGPDQSAVCASLR